MEKTREGKVKKRKMVSHFIYYCCRYPLEFYINTQIKLATMYLKLPVDEQLLLELPWLLCQIMASHLCEDPGKFQHHLVNLLVDLNYLNLFLQSCILKEDLVKYLKILVYLVSILTT